MKSPRRSVYIDLFHKGFVYTCIAVTLYATSVVGSRYYHYTTQIKPQIEEKKRLEKEELLAEGSSTKIKELL